MVACACVQVELLVDTLRDAVFDEGEFVFEQVCLICLVPIICLLHPHVVPFD